MVVVGGDAAVPDMLARARIQTCPTGLPGEAYHAASRVDPARARGVIAAVERAAEKAVLVEVQALARMLKQKGYELAAGGVPGTLTAQRPLASILKVHALLHKAEGELYREALAAGCEAAGLSVRRFAPGAALELLQGLAPATEGRLADWGKVLGPPWTRDEREAAAAAWFALVMTQDAPRGF